MAIDVKETIEFVTSYLSDYFENLVRVLVSPARAFNALYRDRRGDIAPTLSIPSPSALDPRLLGFAGCSVLVGSCLLKAAQRDNVALNILERTLFTLFAWFAMGVVAYVVALMLGGRRALFETLTYCIQVFSALFVACAAVHLVWSTVVRAIGLGTTSDSSLFADSLAIYFAVQLALLFAYLTLGISRLHGFGWFRTVVHAMIVTALFVSFNIAISTNKERPIGPMGPPAPDTVSITEVSQELNKLRTLLAAKCDAQSQLQWIQGITTSSDICLASLVALQRTSRDGRPRSAREDLWNQLLVVRDEHYEKFSDESHLVKRLKSEIDWHLDRIGYLCANLRGRLVDVVVASDERILYGHSEMDGLKYAIDEMFRLNEQQIGLASSTSFQVGFVIGSVAFVEYFYKALSGIGEKTPKLRFIPQPPALRGYDVRLVASWRAGPFQLGHQEQTIREQLSRNTDQIAAILTNLTRLRDAALRASNQSHLPR